MPVPPLSHGQHPFTVEAADLEFINNLLLEQERPLATITLARLVMEERLERERRRLQERFRDARFYNPAADCSTGDRLIFPALNFAAGVVVGRRAGHQPELDAFDVISVKFEDDGRTREFASNLAAPHALSREDHEDPHEFARPGGHG